MNTEISIRKQVALKAAVELRKSLDFNENLGGEQEAQRVINIANKFDRWLNEMPEWYVEEAEKEGDKHI